jgi:membrane protease YdiL (CAAX protease family)
MVGQNPPSPGTWGPRGEPPSGEDDRGPGLWGAMPWPSAAEGAPQATNPGSPNGANGRRDHDGPTTTMPWPPPRPAAQVPGPASPAGPNGRRDHDLPAGRPSDSSGPTKVIPARAAWWAGVGFLVGIVVGGIGAAIGEALTGSSTSATSDLLGEAGLWAAMFSTVLLVSRRYGTGSLPRDFGLGIKAIDGLWGICAWAAALAVSGIVLAVFSGTQFAGTNDQILTQQKGHDAGIVVISLIVALGAPFFEELFFRGFLRTALQARFGPHGAVWLQAVFFGLAHTGEANTTLGNISVVLAMFLVGVVLGYTAKLTGRLGAGMIAHCLFNLVAVVSIL